MAPKLTEQERYLRRVESLALSTLPTPIVAAPPQYHDGCMIALIPEAPESVALDHPEALPADDLHVTLCYLGKVQDLSSFDKTKTLSNVRSVIDELGHAFDSSADGVLIMGGSDDHGPATALLVQSDDLVALYDAVSEALDYHSEFPSFIPHMTLGYGVPTELAQEKVGQPLSFKSVIVKFGETKHVIPLPAGLVAAPRGVNTIDRVIDSLGRLWDEALHPRDGEGKFIKKNGAVSGKLSIPSPDRKSVNVVDANRASVVGFHAVDNEVWVLAEITNPDGSKSQGVAKATDVRAVAPVKARLDALYPVSDGDDFIDSSLERQRQLDLILSYITSEYGPDNDENGAISFLETLGLSDKDLDYVFGENDLDFLGGIRRVDRDLDEEELAEQADLIEDAKQVKILRDRVHGIAEDTHVVPPQKILGPGGVDEDAVAALQGGADPFEVKSANLFAAMLEAGRFEYEIPDGVATGVSPIGWFTDPTDQTEHTAHLAGLNRLTRDRAYFAKASVFGAEFNNSDIVHEVLASLISDAVSGGDGAVIVPKAVFGDNPEWDGKSPKDTWNTHQPGHVIAQHAAYLVPSDWVITDMFTETVKLRNDVKDVDIPTQDDMIAAHNEDMGNLYGNSVAKMMLLDYIMLNSDRNPNNALLASSPSGDEGRVIPIDHGMAFDDDPFDSDDPELTSGDLGALFNWFMRYPLSRAWLAYVWGGLELNENVNEDSLRRIIAQFADEYSDLDGNGIVDQFAAIPGVTEAQIEKVRSDMQGVIERIEWLVRNQDAVFDGLTGRGTP